MRSIYFFIGTTAEFIKVAPIIKELKKRRLPFKLIFSGQRRILFEDFKDYLGIIKPDINLPERGDSPSLFFFALWTIKALCAGILTLRQEFKGLNKNNTYFIVHGDTVTSFIGSVIAKIYNLKLVHIESGDLSFNLLEPFPEEIIKLFNVYFGDILFAPNDWAKNNLKNAKGVKISTKQNTLIETFTWALNAKNRFYNFKKYKKYYVLLLHRQEHVVFRKKWSKKVLEFIIKNADKNLNCILIKHPLTVKILNSLELTDKERKNVYLTPLLPYLEFMNLLKNAQFIATDSAFNQLESYLMGLPFLGLRDHTEQIEGLGGNVLIANNNFITIKKFLTNYRKYKTKPITTTLRPSKIIVDYLMRK